MTEFLEEAQQKVENTVFGDWYPGPDHFEWEHDELTYNLEVLEGDVVIANGYFKFDVADPGSGIDDNFYLRNSRSAFEYKTQHIPEFEEKNIGRCRINLFARSLPERWRKEVEATFQMLESEGYKKRFVLMVDRFRSDIEKLMDRTRLEERQIRLDESICEIHSCYDPVEDLWDTDRVELEWPLIFPVALVARHSMSRTKVKIVPIRSLQDTSFKIARSEICEYRIDNEEDRKKFPEWFHNRFWEGFQRDIHKFMRKSVCEMSDGSV